MPRIHPRLWLRVKRRLVIGNTESITMTPDEALERQLELYRAMTGEQRMKIALDLHEFACNVSRAGIRHQFPNADADEVERRLRQRIELSRS